ncbi:hypothetical protein NC652_004895 [Populus alba x Populus x berolinensis]|nr:hypothetical protein NC652_004895 [Populus alba x Populus x berolinensis]
MKFNCCSVLMGMKKKEKIDKQSSRTADFDTALKTLKIKLEHPVETFESDELKTTSFSVSVPFDVQKDSINVQVLSHESPVVDEAAEVAYEGEDEQEDNVSLKRDLSNFDLQSHAAISGEVSFPRNMKLDSSHPLDTTGNEQHAKKAEKKVDEKGIDLIQSGHVSDPGIGKDEFWGPPKLKRSCSNLETSKVLRKIVAQFPLTSQYSEELQGLAEKVRDPSSPTSVISRRSADRVMLKKHSSSQVLPSRSRRLWWKLFLWSHRNLHKPLFVKSLQPAVSKLVSQQGGYSSDTLEPNRAMSKMQSPGSFTVKSMDKGHNNNEEDRHSWNSFHAGISGVTTTLSSHPLPIPSKLPQDHCQRAYTHSTYRETRSTALKDLENLPDCGYSISVTIAFLELDKGCPNCTIIKELYLAGNKTSDAEGLHRLLKLTVLDLSFNKITTTKALGQLVANYKLTASSESVWAIQFRATSVMTSFARQFVASSLSLCI